MYPVFNTPTWLDVLILHVFAFAGWLYIELMCGVLNRVEISFK